MSELCIVTQPSAAKRKRTLVFIGCLPRTWIDGLPLCPYTAREPGGLNGSPLIAVSELHRGLFYHHALSGGSFGRALRFRQLLSTCSSEAEWFPERLPASLIDPSYAIESAGSEQSRRTELGAALSDLSIGRDVQSTRHDRTDLVVGAFNGRVKGVQLAIAEAAEAVDHLVDPEDAIRVAMARQ